MTIYFKLARVFFGLIPLRWREVIEARLMTELQPKIKSAMVSEGMQRRLVFFGEVSVFRQRVQHELVQAEDEQAKAAKVESLSQAWRVLVRRAAGLSGEVPQPPVLFDLIQEIDFLRMNSELLAPVFKELRHKRILYAGHMYYYPWYLSRAIRELGWKADVLNWDLNPGSQIYFHGEDVVFDPQCSILTEQMMEFYVASLYEYDVFHFSNAHGICFGFPVQSVIRQYVGEYAEIHLLKSLAKKIVYTNNSCADGVSQTEFSKWGPESVCSICRWRNEPSVCSDERNMTWGKFRNSVADYQCLLGGNRVDFNDDLRIHEVPEVYCLDTEFWNPKIEIPDAFRLPAKPLGTVWLYHAVGNKTDRTTEEGINIKSSHVYLPLVHKLKDEGHLIELLKPEGIPNKEVRFLQAQADIFLEMLTYGWFGANAREAMMLGKPVICFIRPEWLASVREEIPDYAAELPIISATPATVEGVLRDLIANPEKRHEIGQRSRAFAVKWHSAEAGGRRFNEIYSRLLQGDPLLRVPVKSESAHG